MIRHLALTIALGLNIQYALLMINRLISQNTYLCSAISRVRFGCKFSRSIVNKRVKEKSGTRYLRNNFVTVKCLKAGNLLQYDYYKCETVLHELTCSSQLITRPVTSQCSSLVPLHSIHLCVSPGAQTVQCTT